MDVDQISKKQLVRQAEERGARRAREADLRIIRQELLCPRAGDAAGSVREQALRRVLARIEAAEDGFGDEAREDAKAVVAWMERARAILATSAPLLVSDEVMDDLAARLDRLLPDPHPRAQDDP